MTPLPVLQPEPEPPSLSQTPGRACRGGLILETVIAVTVMAMAGTALATGLSTTYISFGQIESQSIAENIGRNQMESIFSSPYLDPPTTYPSITTPSGYDVTAVAEEYVLGDPRVEKIVVTVTGNGQGVLTLETLRTRQ